MSNAKKKKEKKARERKEKAKHARAQHLEERKADKEAKRQAPPQEKRGFMGGGKPASAKPAGRSGAAGHRTQGK